MSKRILFCGDNAAFQATTLMLLRKGGFDVVSANCTDIFKQASDFNPHIILVEQPVTDVTGELVYNFKTHHYTKNIPLIILGEPYAPDKDRFQNLFFMPKPFRPEELMNFIYSKTQNEAFDAQ